MELYVVVVPQEVQVTSQFFFQKFLTTTRSVSAKLPYETFELIRVGHRLRVQNGGMRVLGRFLQKVVQPAHVVHYASPVFRAFAA